MKSRLLYLLFPLGILTGYLIPRSQPVGESVTKNDTHAPRANGPNRPKSISSPHETARILALADGISASKRQNDKEQKTIASADIPAVITHLLSQAGPSGLNWKVRSEIDRMLVNWATEDFDSAFAWASSYPNKNAAKDFLEVILRERAKTDFEGTMTCMNKIRDESGIKLNLGQFLFDAAAKRSALEAFNVLAAFPSDGNGLSASEVEFPPGFDFKTFAELTSTHMKNNKNDGYIAFSYYPSNSLKEWAKVDSSAALEFYLSSDQHPFNNLGQITSAFINLTKPESAYPWLSEQYAALEGSQRSKFGRSLNSVFPHEMGVAPLVGLVESLPTPALKNEMVTDMLKGFGGTYSNGNKMMYIDLLSLLPTPAERLEVIRQSHMRYSMSEASDEKLSEFGITREQIKNLK